MATAYATPVTGFEFTQRRVLSFLRAEMAPHPGMYFTLMRVVITVVITFVLVATFRMPYAAITLYSIFTVDRSSPRAAVLRVCESIAAITLGVVMALVGVMLFADSPPLTFGYYALELYVVAFLIRTTRLTGPAMNLSLAIYSVHNAWEHPYPAGPHLEQTLWVWLTLSLGFVVSAMVELAFAWEDPLRRIEAELTARMRALSAFFRACAAGPRDAGYTHRAVWSYATAGTSSVRQRISSLREVEMFIHRPTAALATFTALVARLIDVSAVMDCPADLPAPDRNRLADLAGELDGICDVLDKRNGAALGRYNPPLTLSQSLPPLPELERTVALIPTAFEASDIQGNELFEAHQELQIFLPDAFKNPGYQLFALKTMLAAMLCYVLYAALDWPGISTSVVTCMVTALHTTGATTQKQLLRLSGAMAGGLIAIGVLVFLLPELDSITGVTLVVTCVSAFSAWFVLASERLSYFGLQTGLAFYLAFIQDYSATTQLTPARDRAIGVLLGVAVMWLVFEKLWPVSAAEHMRAGLAKNFRLLADLITTLDRHERNDAIRNIRSIRDNVQRGFAAVHGHADSILFELGSPDRREKLVLRDSVLRIQAIMRTLFQVEIAICQYRTQVVPGSGPAEIGQAQVLLDHELAGRLLAVEAVFAGQKALPDVSASLSESFERFEAAVEPWVRALKDPWILSRVSGLKALSMEAVRLVDSIAQCVHGAEPSGVIRSPGSAS